MIYSIKNLRKSPTQKFTLYVDKLEINQGQIYALLGLNGAGKTTLLNMLGFLEVPDSGEVYYKNEKIQYTAQKLLPLRKEVTLIDQKPTLFSTSVYKNLEFGLKLRDVPRQERQQRIKKALDLVNLPSKIMSQAHKLSGGETQRVAIARAIVLEPEVILCDEPLANVDLENRTSIINLFKELNRKQNTTLIFSTHDHLQAASLTRHCIYLDNGRLVKNVFENRFYTTIIPRKGHCECTLNQNLTILLPSTTHPTGQTTLMIDPREISVLATGNEQGPNIFKGKILQITDEEKEIRLIIDIGIQLTLLITSDQYLKGGLLVGSLVKIQIRQEGLHFSK